MTNEPFGCYLTCSPRRLEDGEPPPGTPPGPQGLRLPAARGVSPSPASNGPSSAVGTRVIRPAAEAAVGAGRPSWAPVRSASDRTFLDASQSTMHGSFPRRPLPRASGEQTSLSLQENCHAPRSYPRFSARLRRGRRARIAGRLRPRPHVVPIFPRDHARRIHERNAGLVPNAPPRALFRRRGRAFAHRVRRR